MNARGAINLLVAAITPVLPTGVTCAMGWPTETQLGSIANGTIKPIVSVYDRGPAKNRTRWNKTIMSTLEPLPPGVEPTLSADILPASGVVTLTLGGTLLEYDAVAAVFQLGRNQEGRVVVAGPSDTLTTLAASLASVVNGDSTLSQWLTAAATGPSVVFTSIAHQNIKASTAAANQGQETIEYRRLLRDLQVILWVNNPADRDTISDPIVSLLSLLSTNFGLQDIANTQQWVRVIYNGDLYVDDPVLNNLYRRDIMTYLEYGETITDGLYPVLVAKATLQQSV